MRATFLLFLLIGGCFSVKPPVHQPATQAQLRRSATVRLVTGEVIVAPKGLRVIGSNWRESDLAVRDKEGEEVRIDRRDIAAVSTKEPTSHLALVGLLLGSLSGSISGLYAASETPSRQRDYGMWVITGAVAGAVFGVIAFVVDGGKTTYIYPSARSCCGHTNPLTLSF